jgi:predicted cupin superfamily sugar epimerase
VSNEQASTKLTAAEVIARLGLEAHPTEGGYFRETYRSARSFEAGEPYSGPRSHGTAIYYLLTADTCSAMHRLPGDEVFHFYLGDPVEMLELHPDGRSTRTLLGPVLGEMTVQHTVRAGTWQGSILLDGGRWALLGATMAPGFSYEDYESGTEALIEAFPSRAAMIAARLPRSPRGV